MQKMQTFLIGRSLTRMAKKSSSSTKITRISASDEASAPKKRASAKVVKYDQSDKIDTDPTEKQREKGSFFSRSRRETRAEKRELAATRGSKNPLVAIGRYFAGAWHELREVRWPNRRATWGMTGALLAFTAFFVVLILLLDALFQWLFNLVLGS